MNSVDNFEELKAFFSKHVLILKDDFLFGQIIKRRKDNPTMGGENVVVKDYFLESIDDIDLFEIEVKEICNGTNSRFYVNPNKRNYQTLAFDSLTSLSTSLKNGNNKHIKRLVSSTAGKGNVDKHKKWIVDLDGDDVSMEKRILSVIDGLQPEGSKLLHTFNTLHGKHLITKPFRLDMFKERFPNIDVHKDNPTLIYYNSGRRLIWRG